MGKSRQERTAAAAAKAPKKDKRYPNNARDKNGNRISKPSQRMPSKPAWKASAALLDAAIAASEKARSTKLNGDKSAPEDVLSPDTKISMVTDRKYDIEVTWKNIRRYMVDAHHLEKANTCETDPTKVALREEEIAQCLKEAMALEDRLRELGRPYYFTYAWLYSDHPGADRSVWWDRIGRNRSEAEELMAPCYELTDCSDTEDDHVPAKNNKDSPERLSTSPSAASPSSTKGALPSSAPLDPQQQPATGAPDLQYLPNASKQPKSALPSQTFPGSSKAAPPPTPPPSPESKDEDPKPSEKAPPISNDQQDNPPEDTKNATESSSEADAAKPASPPLEHASRDPPTDESYDDEDSGGEEQGDQTGDAASDDAADQEQGDQTGDAASNKAADQEEGAAEDDDNGEEETKNKDDEESDDEGED
ncbi:hypothetical protein CLAFUW4_06520 [Fulvia fulva]|nr:hypothetical protein CLAFUR4_06528 [Fulvia fulva]KAK4622636.1 hypothetical protein CLAFUR0_06524 [Fulvia fulva]WPV16633.1 hypothetical protein CLAFUW4_06520 [Fulvia fulva]WPV31468.1 hypothetical protein CLAFUW7_06519 [Fulvia fulva]